MALKHADYTIAWICALSLEMAAAKVMLDEVHPSLPQQKSDHNSYTLGSISGHKVVVACLPSGVYGTTSSAIVLAHMLPTFPCLRFALMVGVGGGVPSKTADIRLGDVVVSMPNATSGGVIQYDYGKTLREGRFQRTGSLNKPPQFLLTVISQMRGNHMTGERPMAEILSNTLQKHQEIREQFSRPDRDWLFSSDYNHDSSDPDCSTCDRTQLVYREPRVTEEPHIHYGLIASGNQVIKHAKTRDFIAQEMGILCFEMEAAGLMDQLPCLVIRGICDYCDSHKHKNWQAYAALVAAAYARTLLMAVPAHENTGDAVTEQNCEQHHWMVPFQKNWRFAGREKEIAKLEGLIEQLNGASRVAISGLGGIGKTQITLELAYRIRERDSSCSIFWIPCTSYESVKQAYISIAQTVGIQEVKPAEAKERVRIYLSQESAGKWLLIFDSADDIDMWINDSQTTPALKKFLPQSKQGHILFTTRNRMLAVKLASPHVITVSEPDKETGLKILENSLVDSDQSDQNSASVILLEQLAYLPLAITQATAYINENQICISTYIKLLKKQESHVIELLSEGFEDEGRYEAVHNPIATTWLISFQQIQRLNRLAADYLSFMACINPRDIPQSLLPQPVSDNEGIKAIGLLNAYSFITKHAKGNNLSLHRLVHLATRNWLRNNGQFSLQVLKVADHLSGVFPNDNHSNRQLWREYIPHGLSLIGEDNFRREQGQYIDLVQKIGRCLYQDGRYNEAEPLYMQVMKNRKQVLGLEHPDTLTSMANLALTYQNQGRWNEAEKLGVQVMVNQKQVLGPEHPSTLTSMANLASTYWSQGLWNEAEKLGVQVIESQKQVLGPEHPHTLTSMANLALTYWNQGRWNEAEELGVQVIVIQKQVLGTKHPDTLTSMANLASIYQNQGRWNEAEELKVQVMEIRKQVLGPEHPHNLTSMANLALTYQNQGRWNEAEKLGVQVMESRKQVLGPEHPHTLTSMANLASTYWNQGRRNEAEKLGVQVTESRKQVLGPEHPDTLTSMANLASTYWNQGRWNEAEKLGVQVMESRKQILGPEHPDTLTSMANLALIYQNQERWSEAEELGIQGIITQKQVLGPEHPSTLTSMANLALIYYNQGRWKEAEELGVQVIGIQKQVLGPQHPDTLTSMTNLALTYHNQGRWNEAEELGVQVMEARKQVLGPEHPDTLTSMVNLVYTWESQGKL